MTKPLKVALVTNVLAPYRIASLNAAAAIPDIDLAVYFCAATSPDRPWRFPAERVQFSYRLLPGLRIRLGYMRTRWLNPTLALDLLRQRYDVVVVGGYDQPTYVLATLVQRLRRGSVILWNESTPYDQRSQRPVLRALKRRLVRSFAGALVPGPAARIYCQELGIPDRYIFDAPNAPEDELLRLIDSARDQRSPQSPPPAAFTILYIGRLSSEKGLAALLSAFSGLAAQRGSQAVLHIVGDGPEGVALRDEVARLRLQGVRFFGATEGLDLARHYVEADCVVVPSLSEPWGFVIQEACYAGVPVIASTRAGAAHSMLSGTGAGLLFAPDDVDGLQSALGWLMDHPDERQAMGRAGRDRMRAFTHESWAQGLARACLSLRAGSETCS